MEDGLKRLLRAAEERKQQRNPNQARVRQFEEREAEILREFAGSCGANLSVRLVDGFIRAKITGDALLISDLDLGMKELIQDENVSVTFQAEDGLVIMEIVIRCFS